MFKVEMRPLGSKEIEAKTDADFKNIIIGGHGKMKPVTGLSGQQIEEVIAFVRTLKQ